MKKYFVLLLILIIPSLIESQVKMYDYYNVVSVYDDTNEKWEDVEGVARLGHDEVKIDFSDGTELMAVVDVSSRESNSKEGVTINYFEATLYADIFDDPSECVFAIIYDKTDKPYIISILMGSQENSVKLTVKIKSLKT